MVLPKVRRDFRDKVWEGSRIRQIQIPVDGCSENSHCILYFDGVQYYVLYVRCIIFVLREETKLFSAQTHYPLYKTHCRKVCSGVRRMYTIKLSSRELIKKKKKWVLSALSVHERRKITEHNDNGFSTIYKSIYYYIICTCTRFSLLMSIFIILFVWLHIYKSPKEAPVRATSVVRWFYNIAKFS